MNSAVIAIVDDEKVDEVLKVIHRIDRRNPEVGIRAFVWNVERTVEPVSNHL
jgi:nitrogen regulatory protein PII